METDNELYDRIKKAIEEAVKGVVGRTTGNEKAVVKKIIEDTLNDLLPKRNDADYNFIDIVQKDNILDFTLNEEKIQSILSTLSETEKFRFEQYLAGFGRKPSWLKQVVSGHYVITVPDDFLEDA